VGAGALKPGDAVDGLGTVECITTVFSEKTNNNEMGKQGYPCIPYAVDGLYCTYILNFSCGSIINWFRKKIMHAYKGDEADFFTYVEKDMPNDPTGILVLPYFGGAATPYNNINAKGAIVGVTLDTTDSDLYKSVLEGTAMEMKLNAETVKPYGITVKQLIATGGGSNSDLWLQLKADIQNVPIKSLRSGEGGLCGCAMIQAVAMGACKDLYEARDIFVRYKKEFTPKNVECYNEQYSKYKKLYFAVKELF
jgi:xylulokinase